MPTSSLLIWLTVGLFILGAISGMLGLGVAFAAVPFWGCFFPTLFIRSSP